VHRDSRDHVDSCSGEEVSPATQRITPKGICFAGFAEALESQFPKIAESQPEVLAHHCAKAGQTEKVSLRLGRAGQQSFARWAMREAAEQLSRVLGQIATLPGTAALRGEQIKLKVALANALAHLKGYAAPETRTSLDRTRSLIKRAQALAVETNDQPKDGRTSGYDAEIAEAICERVVSGESLRAICAIPRCRPEPRYSAGSPAIRNFACCRGPGPKSSTPIDVSRARIPTGHCNRALSTRPLPT
jgi:hypothetical protein